RTYTYLSLFGYRVDAVVVNRILPDEVSDPYFAKWKDIQVEHLQTVRESFEPVPIVPVRLFDRAMVGLELLGEMGRELYAGEDPTKLMHRDEPIRVRKRGTSYVLMMNLPFAERTELNVFRKGDELFVRLGS